MPNGLITLKQEWTEKPAQRIPLNLGHPLCRGMTRYYDHHVSDIHSALIGEDSASGNPTYTFGAINSAGQELEIVDTGSSSYVNVPSPVPNSSPVTMIFHLRTDISITDDSRIYADNGVASTILRIISGGAEFLINPLTNDRVSHSVTINAGENYIIGGSWGGDGTYLNVFSWTETDGLKITQNGATSAGTYTVVDPSKINVLSYLDGGIKTQAYWDRQLTDEEVRSYILNPHQVLQPKTLYLPTEYAAAGGFQAAWALTQRRSGIIGAR